MKVIWSVMLITLSFSTLKASDLSRMLLCYHQQEFCMQSGEDIQKVKEEMSAMCHVSPDLLSYYKLKFIYDEEKGSYECYISDKNPVQGDFEEKTRWVTCGKNYTHQVAEQYPEGVLVRCTKKK